MHFLLMSLLGIVLLIKAIKLLRLGNQSSYWKAVKGEVTNTMEIREIGPASRTQKMNHLNVKYKYAMKGVEYTSDRVRYKWNHHNLLQEIKKYPPGQELTVYVNTSNAEQAVLEPGVDATNYVAIAAGIFFITAGLSLALTQ